MQKERIRNSRTRDRERNTEQKDREGEEREKNKEKSNWKDGMKRRKRTRKR